MRTCSLVALFLWGCTSPEPDDGDSDPSQTPFDFLSDAGPTLVTEGSVGEDGLLLDRLVVLLSNDADEAAFEAALASVDGQVAASLTGLPWVTVTIPAVADRQAAEAAAAVVAGQPGVRSARPAWLVSRPEPLEPTVAPLRAAPVGLEGANQPSLGLQRFYTAWNAAPLASNKVSVYVADFFTKNEPIGQLTGLRFVGPSAPLFQFRDDDGDYQGNHGFWVTSVLAAEADERVPVGTHPAPEATMDLVAINALGVGDGVDLILALGRHLPLATFFVLNTSLGFNDALTDLERAEAALAWRELLATRGAQFLHLTTAGNAGHADTRRTAFNSAFTLQASAADLAPLLPASDRSDFEDLLEDARDRVGASIGSVMGHTLTVGSSGDAGDESRFSNRGSDIRMIGESVMGLCERKDATCLDLPFGRLLLADGTSIAAPQATGLAAWLRAIDPSLDAAALRSRMLAAFDGRWVDALAATLALESPTLEVRKALLDYFPGGGFNQDDVTALLTEIDAGDRGDPEAFRTWPKADLNGDGRARRDSRGPFDLDGDGALGTVTVSLPGPDGAEGPDLVLDEATVSDLEVLCWGAYAGPYTGDPDARDRELLASCVPAEGLRGTITSTRREVCPHGERTTSLSATVALDEEGVIVSVSGTASEVGEFSNVTPGDCVAHLDFRGPMVLTGDGATSEHLPFGDGSTGSLQLVWMRGGQTSYTGLDNCGGPRVEEVEANIFGLRYVRTEAGFYDFAKQEVIEGDCTTTETVTGVMR